MTNPFTRMSCEDATCGNCPRCQARAAEKSDVHQKPVVNVKINGKVITTDKKAAEKMAELVRKELSKAPRMHQGGATGLPVKGYKPVQPDWAIDLVNQNKILEEKVLRQMDKHIRIQGSAEIDQRAVAIARTKLQEAFMWLNRGVFQPGRLTGEIE